MDCFPYLSGDSDSICPGLRSQTLLEQRDSLVRVHWAHLLVGTCALTPQPCLQRPHSLLTVGPQGVGSESRAHVTRRPAHRLSVHSHVGCFVEPSSLDALPSQSCGAHQPGLREHTHLFLSDPFVSCPKPLSLGSWVGPISLPQTVSPLYSKMLYMCGGAQWGAPTANHAWPECCVLLLACACV